MGGKALVAEPQKKDFFLRLPLNRMGMGKGTLRAYGFKMKQMQVHSTFQQKKKRILN